MYWFPREERTRNFHVWLEYDLTVLELVFMMAERMLWERCSFLGWMSLRKSLFDWAERRLFCSWLRWPFTVKEYWGRYLEIRLAERPGHDMKWPLLMAAIKVELTVLKADAWKYWESLCLVVSWHIIPLAWFG